MAMYHQKAPEIARDIQKSFPTPITLPQVWCFVKWAKLVRRSCKSNAAFNPAAELAFPGFRFRQYDIGKRTNDGRNKPIFGLSITAPDGTKFDDSDPEEE